MGWTSSADHMQGNHLWFKTKEDAIHFAEKQGYEYYVQEPNVRAFRPKQYAANFTVGFYTPAPRYNSDMQFVAFSRQAQDYQDQINSRWFGCVYINCIVFK